MVINHRNSNFFRFSLFFRCYGYAGIHAIIECVLVTYILIIAFVLSVSEYDQEMMTLLYGLQVITIHGFMDGFPLIQE